jgi:Xaa-Pro aminopeptidase
VVNRTDSFIGLNHTGSTILPGAKTFCARWQEQEAGLKQFLEGAKKVAMQYSPRCAVPYVANVDAGTVELIRSLGLEVVRSAELIQIFEAKWTPAPLEMHLEAGWVEIPWRTNV